MLRQQSYFVNTPMQYVTIFSAVKIENFQNIEVYRKKP